MFYRRIGAANLITGTFQFLKSILNPPAFGFPVGHRRHQFARGLHLLVDGGVIGNLHLVNRHAVRRHFDGFTHALAPVCLRLLHHAGNEINVDLIAGMVEETEANWRECVSKTIEMSPDSVTIYEMEIPYNTTIYQQMKAAGKLVAPVADWETKRGWVQYAFQELERAGYQVGSAYTAIKHPERTKFVYRDRLWAGADLLSLGVASFGHLGGTHYQNLHDFEPYVARVQQGELPIWRALTPSAEERLIRELILQLKLGHVSSAYFRQKFGVELSERFSGPMARLRDWGFLSMDGDQVLLNREGLLQVDRLLYEFFLPQHKNARYA